MKRQIFGLLRVASAAFFFALSSAAFAQNSGSVTANAFPIGLGPSKQGFASLLCGSAQLAVGQSAAAPICQTLSGDVTMGATGVTAIGATKVTSGMLNSSVFSTAHSWAGQQTFVAPILGAIASGDGSALTGTAASFTAGHVTTNANLTGDVTSVGNATTLTNAPVIAKVLTGFTSGAGTVTAADSILSAIQKVYGNDALKLPLAGGTMSGNIAMGGNAITGGGAITGTAITGTSYSGLPAATASVAGIVKPDGTTITVSGGVITASGASATSITVGTTTIGTPVGNGPLTDNSGVLGNVVWGQLPGIATNTAATSGNVGEYISSGVALGSGPSLPSGTPQNITSVSLTAGDWDCSGNVGVNNGGTLTNFFGWIGTASASMPTLPNGGSYVETSGISANGPNFWAPVGLIRFLISSTTTVFLEAQITTTVSSTSGGFLGCRRMR